MMRRVFLIINCPKFKISYLNQNSSNSTILKLYGNFQFCYTVTLRFRIGVRSNKISCFLCKLNRCKSIIDMMETANDKCRPL